MDNVMIDLETWGRTPKAVVTQIAGIYFDPESGALGEEFNTNINAVTELANDFTVDAETLYFWFNQSPAALHAAIGAKGERNQSKYSWQGFAWFLQDAKNIWCHATFDYPICVEHWKHYGIKTTWPYWAPKDLRSIVEVAGIDHRKYKTRAAASGSTIHSALDDCKVQIEYLVDSLKKIKEGSK
jgi:hypothetical protein